jgi:hypothetical protein
MGASISSAGWTYRAKSGALKLKRDLQHHGVKECAVIGIPDDILAKSKHLLFWKKASSSPIRTFCGYQINSKIHDAKGGCVRAVASQNRGQNQSRVVDEGFLKDLVALFSSREIPDAELSGRLNKCHGNGR